MGKLPNYKGKITLKYTKVFRIFTHSSEETNYEAKILRLISSQVTIIAMVLYKIDFLDVLLS